VLLQNALELVHVGAIFCINPLAPRFQRHPFYKHVFFKFLVGAYLFVTNQIEHHQIIPIKLGSKTSEVPSRIYLSVNSDMLAALLGVSST
jgi:hypothetical protein